MSDIIVENSERAMRYTRLGPGHSGALTRVESTEAARFVRQR
jgi:hypothetical protein